MELITANEVTGYELPMYIDKSGSITTENHGMFRLVFIEEGTGILTINDRTTVLMAPSIICLNELDRVELTQCWELRGRVIYFNPIIINNELTYETIRGGDDVVMPTSVYQDYFLLIPFIERGGNFLGKFEISPGAEKRVKQLFNQLEQEITTLENEFWPCRTRSFFLEILFLLQYLHTGSTSEGDIEFTDMNPEIGGIILYLHRNYGRKVTIKELESTFNVNRTTMSERFSRSTGLSVMEYLIRLRMRLAGMMLRDTMLPIFEIMYRVGFNDNSYFNRTFKRLYGDTPSEYRRKAMLQ